jgi:hypothetical protein
MSYRLNIGKAVTVSKYHIYRVSKWGLLSAVVFKMKSVHVLQGFMGLP